MTPYEGTSAAARLLALYDAIMRVPEVQGQKLHEMWQLAIGVELKEGEALEDVMLPYLLAVRNEIDLAARTLDDAGCPKALYDSYLKHLRGMAAPTAQNGDWSSHRRSLNGEYRLALGGVRF